MGGGDYGGGLGVVQWCSCGRSWEGWGRGWAMVDGHAKQGGWHNFSEPGHGFTPSRSNEKIFGDENCKPSGSSADGKFSRNSRENRGSFGARRIGEVILGRMVHGKWSWQTDSEDQNNKTGNNGLGTGQILERENSMGSIDRKTLNWTCSGSLTSRGDAVACATSAAPSDETNYMKKPRLGRGEGLAKYEKKKVEGPDDSATKNGMVVCVNTEPSHSNGSILSDKSLGFMFSDCASPGTPSSVACRSSPGPSSSQRECQAKPCEDLVVNTGGSLRPAPLQLVSSGDMIAKEATGGLEEGRGQLKDEDIDSPGAVTSKFVEPHRSVNAAAVSESVKHGWEQS
ncbi:duplicated homeodomain-like superfamily protein [Actinidia rufa]|uniref:Duplicated homeodomain-like superfamily protein n=1 Tax=Actinidia rufa TaxID=165716 RepID=A0A7J0GVB1_9ERIC|nr:duplicated homeodomain-like superfamily protein [Actinidia rufa]